jgi:ferredoxin
MKMKAIVDEETCVGCGLCADTCPSVFEMADGVAKVITAEVAINDADDCRKAAEDCPVEAITIDE